MPTWTRCSIWSDDLSNTTFFEANVVGAVGGTDYTLSIVNEGLKQHPFPRTYSMDQTGFTPIDVTFTSVDGTRHWTGTSGAEAVVTFADRASGSINAVLPDRPNGNSTQQVQVSGTWRCGWVGSVNAVVPQLSGTAQSPIAPPVEVPVPPTVAPVPAQPPPADDPMAALRAQGVSAICNDGTCSYSQHRSGTCSHHGGLREWTGLI